MTTLRLDTFPTSKFSCEEGCNISITGIKCVQAGSKVSPAGRRMQAVPVHTQLSQCSQDK